MMGLENYTIQIIPEDGEVKEIHLSKGVVLCLGVLFFVIISTILYFSVNVGKIMVNKAEYNLLKSKVVNLENRELEIRRLNSKIEKLYDIANKLNGALGLEISLEEFYDSEKENFSPANSETSDELEGMKAEAMKLQAFVPNILPTTGGWISKRFSADHKAIDISLKEGTSLYSTMNGKVTSIEDRKYLGKTLEIRNDEGFAIIFGHLSEILVRRGEEVKKGQLVALSGNTGRSDAPHLHYGIRMQGKWVNPIDYLLVRR